MNLRHIRFFVVLAEELNFTRASARLHVAQPALSQQIRLLEESMGTLLFDRAARPIRLTSAGAYFLIQARDILDRYEQASNTVRDISLGRAGWLGIGFTRSAIYSVLPPALKAYSAQHPTVELKLYEMLTEEHERALQQHQIHLAIGRQAQALANCETKILLQEPLVVVVASDHPLSRLRTVPVSRLRDCPFVLYPRYPGAQFPRLIQRLCQDAGFKPRVVHETHEIQTALALVAAGLGVTLVGESVAKNGLRDLAYLPLEGAQPSDLTTLTCTYRANDVHPALHDFVRILMQQAS